MGVEGGKFGKVEIANNGTLFLDEIDNLTFSMVQDTETCRKREIYHVTGDL